LDHHRPGGLPGAAGLCGRAGGQPGLVRRRPSRHGTADGLADSRGRRHPGPDGADVRGIGVPGGSPAHLGGPGPAFPLRTAIEEGLSMNDGAPGKGNPAGHTAEFSQTNLAVARPMVKELAIHGEGVSYWFGEGETRAQVLFDNALEIGRGEVVIMTGPSGSG